MSTGNTNAATETRAPSRDKAYLLRPRPELKRGLEAYRNAWAASRPGARVTDQDLLSHLCTLGLQQTGQVLPEVPA